MTLDETIKFLQSLKDHGEPGDSIVTAWDPDFERAMPVTGALHWGHDKMVELQTVSDTCLIDGHYYCNDCGEAIDNHRIHCSKEDDPEAFWYCVKCFRTSACAISHGPNCRTEIISMT